MKRALILIGIALAAGLLGLVLFDAMRTPGESQKFTSDSETAKAQSPEDNAAPPDFKRLRDEAETFLTLRPGEFSSVHGFDFLGRLRDEAENGRFLAAELQSADDIERRLLGLFIQLELSGYSEEIAEYARQQDNVVFETTIAKWLYSNRDFANWEALVGRFGAEWKNADSQKLFAYLADPDGPHQFPASFGIFNLGEIHHSQLRRIMRPSLDLQNRFGAWLIQKADLSPHARNTGLGLLAELRSPVLDGAVDHFIEQTPAESRTRGFLMHLKDRATEQHLAVYEEHETQIADAPIGTLPGIRSTGILLDAIARDPSIEISETTLVKLQKLLDDSPQMTRRLQEKQADLAYAIWLKQATQ